jgi:hypothetical protein
MEMDAHHVILHVLLAYLECVPVKLGTMLKTVNVSSAIHDAKPVLTSTLVHPVILLINYQVASAVLSAVLLVIQRNAGGVYQDIYMMGPTANPAQPTAIHVLEEYVDAVKDFTFQEPLVFNAQAAVLIVMVQRVAQHVMRIIT